MGATGASSSAAWSYLFYVVRVYALTPSVLPRQEMDIPEKDLEVSTMRSGGAGGQNVNKIESSVRIKHIPSGIAVRCSQERSQVSVNEVYATWRVRVTGEE